MSKELGGVAYWNPCLVIGDEEQKILVPAGITMISQHTGGFVQTLRPITLYVNQRETTDYANHRVARSAAGEFFTVLGCSIHTVHSVKIRPLKGGILREMAIRLGEWASTSRLFWSYSK